MLKVIMIFHVGTLKVWLKLDIARIYGSWYSVAGFTSLPYRISVQDQHPHKERDELEFKR
jgi:hypothetical protein